MEKVDIASLAQLLNAIKDNLEKIEEAQEKNDGELLASVKKEILVFQKKIQEML
ncbi:hypothetical protein J4462_01320 [Candidatus Pacearchaeota archaeon]|nr:hypothetical protein [Candidatus Pacearchaeota archaeon]